LLSFGSGLLVFFIGRRLFGPRQGLWAAAIWVLYPSYLYANVLILTEVLFTFLVLAACLCALKVLDPGRRVLAWALVVGSTIGLAALTRSVLWPFPLLLVPIIAWLRGGSLRERMGVGALVLVGYVLTVSPWVVRNTNLQKTFVVVDTMGGLNLRMGNYEHTLEDRMWDGVSLTGDQAWSFAMVHEHPEASFWTEGQREKWARQRAAEYMLANPMITARRAVLKFADFWGLEREYIAALRAGQYPAAPSWFRPVSSAAVVAAYVATMLLAGWGLFVTRWTDWRLHVIPLLIVVWICGIHTVVFGHSRYHLPIMPILIVYAAAALNDRISWFRWIESGWRGRLLAVFVVALAFVWARDLFRDVDRIGQFLSKAFA
jgi:4-amino-4-deoxy-L-arabinose transferase-like glycosyltransferase